MGQKEKSQEKFLKILYIINQMKTDIKICRMQWKQCWKKNLYNWKYVLKNKKYLKSVI